MSSKLELIKELKKYIGNIKTKKDAELVDSLFEDEYDVSLEDIVEIMSKDYDSDQEDQEILNVLEHTDDETEDETDNEEEEIKVNYDEPSLEELRARLDALDEEIQRGGKMTGGGKADSDKVLKDSIKAIMSVKGLGNFMTNKIKGKGKSKNKWELHAIMLFKPLRKNGINKRLRDYGLLDDAKGRKIEDFPNRWHINVLNKRIFKKFRSKKLNEDVNLVYGMRK